MEACGAPGAAGPCVAGSRTCRATSPDTPWRPRFPGSGAPLLRQWPGEAAHVMFSELVPGLEGLR